MYAIWRLKIVESDYNFWRPHISNMWSCVLLTNYLPSICEVLYSTSERILLWKQHALVSKMGKLVSIREYFPYTEYKEKERASFIKNWFKAYIAIAFISISSYQYISNIRISSFQLALLIDVCCEYFFIGVLSFSLIIQIIFVFLKIWKPSTFYNSQLNNFG